MALSFVPRPGSNTKEYIAYKFASLLSTKSFDKLSVETIAEECGISRTTFYRYFEDKYALLIYIYTRELDELIEKSATCLEEYSRTVEFMSRERKLFRNALLHDKHDTLKKYVFRRSFESLEQHVKSGLKCSELPEDYIYAINYACSGCINMWTDWLLKDSPIPPEEFAKWMYENTPEKIRKYCD